MDRFTYNMIKRADIERNQSDSMKLSLMQMTTSTNDMDNSHECDSIAHDRTAVAKNVMTEVIAYPTWQEPSDKLATNKTWEYIKQHKPRGNLYATLNYFSALSNSSYGHKMDTFKKVCSARNVPTAAEGLGAPNNETGTINKPIENLCNNSVEDVWVVDGSTVTATVARSETNHTIGDTVARSETNHTVGDSLSETSQENQVLSSYDAEEFLEVALGSTKTDSLPQLFVDKPTTMIDKPITMTDKPTTMTDKPTTMTDKPTTMIETAHTVAEVHSLQPVDDKVLPTPSQYNTPEANSTSQYGVEDGDDITSWQRTLKEYRTLTKLQRRSALPRPIQHRGKPSLIVPHEKKSPNLELLDSLLQEVSIQQDQITQASKAIEFCRTTKEFRASEELVEAERLLLTAELRRHAALRTIHHLKLKDQPDELKEEATISLNNLFLPLKAEFLATNDTSGINVWFVCVTSYKEIVLSTKAVCQVTNDGILLANQLLMPKIVNNFKILIDIYTLRLGRTEKHHKNTHRLVQKCKKKMSPLKKSFSTEQLKHFFGSGGVPKVEAVCQSSFRLAGSVEIQVEDLYSDKSWQLKMVPLSSPIVGTLDMNIETFSSRLFISHDGFLNILMLPGGTLAWKLAWCKLSGHVIDYWNSPSDADEKLPLGSIDLRKCVSSSIAQVDRSLCARPFTLLVETTRPIEPEDCDTIIQTRHTNFTILSHFLSASSKGECEEWCQKLSYVVATMLAFTRTTPG